MAGVVWAARKRVLSPYFPPTHRAEAGEAEAKQREGGGLGDGREAHGRAKDGKLETITWEYQTSIERALNSTNHRDFGDVGERRIDLGRRYLREKYGADDIAPWSKRQQRDIFK